MGRGLGAGGRRPQGRAFLGAKKKLERRGAAGEVIEAAMARIGELGYLDDAGYAKRRAVLMAERGYGDYAIRVFLEGLGLPEKTVLDALAAGAVSPEALDDFIRSEASLTGKEQEELKARLRHTKKKQRSGPRTRAEKEKELARHVVESWTKYDRARWKKERQRHDKNDES